jgi:hypothetical protein
MAHGRNTLIRRYLFCPGTPFLLPFFFPEIDFPLIGFRRAGCFRAAGFPLDGANFPLGGLAVVVRFGVRVAGTEVGLGCTFLVGMRSDTLNKGLDQSRLAGIVGPFSRHRVLLDNLCYLRDIIDIFHELTWNLELGITIK